MASGQVIWEGMPLDIHNQFIIQAGSHSEILLLHCNSLVLPHVVQE
jgi:hypothetical protein